MAMVALKLAPLRALYQDISTSTGSEQEIIELIVKPLVENVNTKLDR